MTPVVRASVPLACILLLCLLTYPGVLTGGVMLPTDWLYEAYYPWKAMSPSTTTCSASPKP